MKAEINNENKVKFFALYWGYENEFVFTDSFGLEVHSQVNPTTIKMVYVSNNDCKMLLKPLSSISDEDLVEVDFTFPNGKPEDLEMTFNFDGTNNQWRAFSRGKVVEGIFCSIHFDTLRSKGYALPWMGLTVEEMVEAGWIKLT